MELYELTDDERRDLFNYPLQDIVKQTEKATQKKLLQWLNTREVIKKVIKIESLLQFAVAILNEFGNNCRNENDHWDDYVSEEDIKKWLENMEESEANG